ncbi:ATP-binding protein [Yinghuangia aomiensis]|uniref:ATP-binding protein n=1 Tax=Yinghuangia aomiensis TaxID=676205 RepID=UPI0031ECE68B
MSDAVSDGASAAADRERAAEEARRMREARAARGAAEWARVIDEAFEDAVVPEYGGASADGASEEDSSEVSATSFLVDIFGPAAGAGDRGAAKAADASGASQASVAPGISKDARALEDAETEVGTVPGGASGFAEDFDAAFDAAFEAGVGVSGGSGSGSGSGSAGKGGVEAEGKGKGKPGSGGSVGIGGGFQDAASGASAGADAGVPAGVGTGVRAAPGAAEGYGGAGLPGTGTGAGVGAGAAGAAGAGGVGGVGVSSTAPGPTTLTQIAVGHHLLTVGGPDGTEAVPLPASSRPLPRRRAAARRPSGYPPLGRQAEIAEVRGLLGRGTSVRIGGPAGIGRSTLLKHLASGDAAGAPDGVVVLDGYRSGLDDLLQQFHDACFEAEAYRPTREALGELLGGVAALIVIDDLDLRPDEMTELLAIAPECVFLVSAPSPAPTPDGTPAPASAAFGGELSRAESPFHEIMLGGLPQDAAFALLNRVAGRELDDEELAWAAALWFEVDGHPGRFAQAGALLARLGTAVPRDDYDNLPELPSPGEPQLFVPRLVPLLSRPAQQVLRLGAALDGVLPDPAHLPALTGANGAHSAANELVEAGLVVVENGRYRLAGGVADEAAGQMRGPSSWAVAAIQHFTWWVSHPTVTPAEIAEEADVVLACMREVERLGKSSSVRVLARAAAPAFATALRFEAWRATLLLGSSTSAATGAVADQAWFHHELAILALCTGENAKAREEASTASRLRDAGDMRGLAADRRILVLAGERPGTFGAEAGVVQRRVTMAGKRGVLTLAAAGVLVVTLAVVVAIGSDDPSGGGNPGNTSVSVTNGVPAAGGNPAAPGAPGSSNAPGTSGTPSATRATTTATATSTATKSATSTKSASATSTKGSTQVAPPPGDTPGSPPNSPKPPSSSPPSSGPATQSTPPTGPTGSTGSESPTN